MGEGGGDLWVEEVGSVDGQCGEMGLRRCEAVGG